ncbi:hypothetical protein CEXT_240521 [Caerostris extrusa]|uniref:Uncharacterized protein n=1 Tax=Caerostris extrusa TaxID=172846 RepID=A0AAV4QJA8_CAEEX|nr:hypothetical protein CEXT_240521 [Caerostris extrusa]
MGISLACEMVVDIKKKVSTGTGSLMVLAYHCWNGSVTWMSVRDFGTGFWKSPYSLLQTKDELLFSSKTYSLTFRSRLTYNKGHRFWFRDQWGYSGLMQIVILETLSRWRPEEGHETADTAIVLLFHIVMENFTFTLSILTLSDCFARAFFYEFLVVT